MKRAIEMIVLVFALGFVCACNAVTPGPVTTRSSAAVLTTAASTEAEKETTTQAVTEAPTESAAEETETETEAATMPDGDMMTTSAGVNIRSGPGADFGVIGSLEEGEEILVIDYEGNWAKIWMDGEDAYVSTKYIE